MLEVKNMFQPFLLKLGQIVYSPPCTLCKRAQRDLSTIYFCTTELNCSSALSENAGPVNLPQHGNFSTTALNDYCAVYDEHAERLMRQQTYDL